MMDYIIIIVLCAINIMSYTENTVVYSQGTNMVLTIRFCTIMLVNTLRCALS